MHGGDALGAVPARRCGYKALVCGLHRVAGGFGGRGILIKTEREIVPAFRKARALAKKLPGAHQCDDRHYRFPERFDLDVTLHEKNALPIP